MSHRSLSHQVEQSVVTLTHTAKKTKTESQKTDHHNSGIPTQRSACTAHIKGKKGLKGDTFRLIWLKGGLWRGWVGGGLRPEINKVLSFNMSHM